MRPLVLGFLLICAVPRVAAKDDGREQDIRYDSATVADVMGVVDSIREVAAPTPLAGIFISLKCEDGSMIDVYLGPASFAKEFVSNFAKRSQIQVTGSKVKSGNATLLLAREVRKGEITLYLRDKHGKPFWNSRD